MADYLYKDGCTQLYIIVLRGEQEKTNHKKIDIELIPIDCTAKFTFSIEKLRKEMLKNERGHSKAVKLVSTKYANHILKQGL